MAERQGFEPWVTQRATAVFETAPFNHSGTSPCERHNVARQDYNKEPRFLQLPFRDMTQSGKIAPRNSGESHQG
jgi:hypothetical protein